MAPVIKAWDQNSDLIGPTGVFSLCYVGKEDKILDQKKWSIYRGGQFMEVIWGKKNIELWNSTHVREVGNLGGSSVYWSW